MARAQARSGSTSPLRGAGCSEPSSAGLAYVRLGIPGRRAIGALAGAVGLTALCAALPPAIARADEPPVPKDADHAMVDASAPADPDAAAIWKQKAALIERDHWAYQPMGNPRPPRPAGAPSSTGDIDRFLIRAMQEQAVVPQGRADRRTLLRRASFDLTGLPPTYEEIRAFEEDTRPDAWARVIDRLLASAAYGERWARHWLDVARYADSNGLDENTAFGNAWRWRDWVVRAFNDNLPIDRFITMQPVSYTNLTLPTKRIV